MSTAVSGRRRAVGARLHAPARSRRRRSHPAGPLAEPRMPSFHGVRSRRPGALSRFVGPAPTISIRARDRSHPRAGGVVAERGDSRSFGAVRRRLGHLGLGCTSWRGRGRPRLGAGNRLAGITHPGSCQPSAPARRSGVGRAHSAGLPRPGPPVRPRPVGSVSRPPRSSRPPHPKLPVLLRWRGAAPSPERRNGRTPRARTKGTTRRAPTKADARSRGARHSTTASGAAAKPKPARKGPGGDDRSRRDHGPVGLTIRGFLAAVAALGQ